MQRYLRPRCATCRRAGHAVCPQVVPVASTVPRRRRVTRHVAPASASVSVLQPRVQRCCSFCGISGHYKPKCEKYKIFVDEVKPFETDEMLSALVEPLLKDMQNIFCRFVNSQFNPVQIFSASNNGFRAFVKMFMEYFDAPQIDFPPQQPQQLQPQQLQPQNSKIVLELCKGTSNVKKECGICLSDEIPCSKIAKLGCGHEFCCDCTEKFINAKPCCALCRADVKKVSVSSKTALNKFKKNKKFSI